MRSSTAPCSDGSRSPSTITPRFPAGATCSCAPRRRAGPACAAAIAGTDFLSSTSGLRLPTLAIAGDKDGSTPPDLVFETAALIPGAQTALIRGAGHLPCVEKPEDYARVLTDFLKAQGA